LELHIPHVKRSRMPDELWSRCAFVSTFQHLVPYRIPAHVCMPTSLQMLLQVGTAVVTRGKDQRLALGRLGALVEQLEALVRSGRQMILVSSGAVSVGRQKLRQSQILNSSPLEMQISGPATVCSKAAYLFCQTSIICSADLQCLWMHTSKFRRSLQSH